MATIKKKSKKKTIIIVCVVLAIAIAGAVYAVIAIKNKAPEVKLTTVSTNDIYETVSATGAVSAGLSKEYKVGAIATVKEVFVKPGDVVKQGDKLATFDTSTLSGEVSKLQDTYNNARAEYNEAVKAQKESDAKVKAVDTQIADLQNQLDKLLNSSSSTSKPSFDDSKRPDFTLPSISDDDLASFAEIGEELLAELTDLIDTIIEVTEDAESADELIRIVIETIVDEINNGNSSSDDIAEEVVNAINKAIEDGVLEIIESDAIDRIAAAVKDLDIKNIESAIKNNKNTQIASLKLQITALSLQKKLYSVMSSDSTVKLKKEMMDTTKGALDAIKEASKELEEGWVASFDGTITACDLVAGKQASLLSGSITLENLDTMVVTVSLNEYDIHKIQIGMPAKITTAYGSYSGEVITKAPTASGGSSGSLLDSVGSMAGISGLSSLTASGAGVEVQVRVDNTDENIIIGFDADVEIESGSYIGVTVVPSESLVLEKTGTYVYLYNEEEKEITKTPIETGAVSVTYYEVKSGIKPGDRIVSTPSAEFKEDTIKVKVAK